MENRTAQPNSVPTGAVMVCGGGIGGIQAALDLANSGFKVYLVEPSPSIGGRMSGLDKTFPTGDCATCIVSPKLVECARNTNIEILTLSEVEEVTGDAGNFAVTIRKKARLVDEKKCNACGDCERACPVRVPNEFNRGLDERPAIGRPYLQAVPNIFTIMRREQSPCASACPLGQKAQAYISLIARGKFDEAAAIIRETNPLPSICGYVCHRPCEAECQRGRYDEPVSIRALKRFVIQQASDGASPSTERRAEKVAVIGSGPAGLGAADWLAQRGYGVTIFEALPVVGGMMRMGIPEFRLPREVIDRDIAAIEALGVQIRTNCAVGGETSIQGLLSDGYSAVFVAAGAQASSSLGIEGEDLPGVHAGLAFIKKANLGEPARLGRKAVVIGGGNAAMDAARTARRLGSDVTVLYRRTRREMPADPAEVQEAIVEGVRFAFLVNPKWFIGRDGRLAGVECIRMALSEEKDSSGRRRPEPVPGSEHIIEADDAIVAIGQQVQPDFSRDVDLTLNRRGLLDVDPVTLATNVPGVFAGGDVVAGAGTLSEAVAAGRRAAESIESFIRGEDMAAGRAADPRLWDEERHERLEQAQRRFPIERERRVPLPREGYTEEMAIQEASRCLACGVCCECMECVKVCQPKAIDHGQRDELVRLDVGAILAAPGASEFEARLRGEFGFGRYPNVVTNVQFERMLSASGPFAGQIQRPSDSEAPKRIAFIQCVGSRDHATGRSYCSAFCCMAAIKEAVTAKEHDPGLEIAIFYMDIRAFGKDFDRYFERAKDEYGIEFIRAIPSRLIDMPGSRNLRLAYVTSETGRQEREFDLVVLSVGLAPTDETRRLAEKLGIELDPCGFSQTRSLEPVAASRPGIFVAGVFQGPKDIPETVAQASAAAARAMELLAPARGSLVREKSYPPERDLTDAPPRVGLFVCHCGVNIASVVDVEAVVEAAKRIPGVAYAETSIYACADNSQERIKSLINEHDLNRLVVASCTPRTHEAIFRDTARESGLNPYLVEMANIRDQCSWVHASDHEAATAKALDLVRMAVGRACRLLPLTTEMLPVVQEALVIGGGAAGLTAALSLALQGFKAHVVEKENRLGGRLHHIYRTLAGEDVQSFKDRLISEVEAHPNISVYPGAEVVKLDGHIGSFTSELSDGRVIRHGVTIVATGGAPHRPDEYLLGRDERVTTAYDLEERLEGGEIGIPDGGTVLMIQCVGSRNEERPYCSRVCCSAAVKNALRLKERRPDLNVIVLYREMRTYGRREQAYQRAREAGVLFIRYDDEGPPAVSADGRLTISFVEPSTGRQIELPVDLLALSTPVAPAPDNERISELARVPLGADGFFLEAHVKLRPVDFASEGIFLCGAAHSPKPLEENISQALAAAGRAATILSRKSLPVGGQVSVVDVRKCASCLTCVKVCPYGAPVLVGRNGKTRVEIEAAKCMGCGSCAAQCPAKAIQLQHFLDGQIAAAIDAMAEEPALL